MSDEKDGQLVEQRCEVLADFKGSVLEKANLERTHHDLEILLSAIPVRAIVLDPRGRILHFTSGAADVVDLGPNPLGEKLADLVEDRSDLFLTRDIKQALRAKTPQEQELQGKGAKWFRRRIVPVMSADRPVTLIVHFQEIQKGARNLRRENRQLQRTVDLLQRVAVIGNEATSVKSALSQTVTEVCEELGWPIGHAFLTGPDQEMSGSSFWCASRGIDIRDVRQATERVTRAPRKGLVGRVIATGEPLWSNDLSADDGFFRFAELEALGIKSIYAFPILVGSVVVGVLEFLTLDSNQPDSALVQGLTELGTQLGRVFERRDLSLALETRTVEEQRRIAQELHDTIGQQLSGVSMLLKSMERKIDNGELPADSLVRSTLSALEEAKQDVRRLARGLIPLEISRGGLAGALEELVHDVCTLHQIRYRCDLSDAFLPENEFVATSLYQIAQEMIQNAVEHSQTRRLEVSLGVDPESGWASLSVRDFGTGMKKDPSGIGFQIMRYRAGLIDGLVEVNSKVKKGTEVICRLPV